MKKVQITADVELNSELGTISIQNNEEDLLINISSPSAVIYPLRVYLGLRKYLHLRKYVNQNIRVMISNKDVIAIKNGQVNYLKKWWIFNFLFKALIKKGI